MCLHIAVCRRDNGLDIEMLTFWLLSSFPDKIVIITLSAVSFSAVQYLIGQKQMIFLGGVSLFIHRWALLPFASHTILCALKKVIVRKENLEYRAN